MARNSGVELSGKVSSASVVVVDANFLVFALRPGASDVTAKRIDYFLATLEANKGKLLVPTPSLAEYFVRADMASRTLHEKMERRRFYEVVPFDIVAAMELSLIERGALNSQDKRDGVEDAWQKVKIDRQIVAIAKSRRADRIISNDAGLRTHARRVFISTLSVEELDLPPEDAQRSLLPEGEDQSRTPPSKARAKLPGPAAEVETPPPTP